MPEQTAVRVALWRALHLQVDPPPHVLVDDVGLRLVSPDPEWRQRHDMDPQFTRVLRAWIVARARFVDDLILREASRGVQQVVLLGAGLDSFAQRHGESVRGLDLFEIDQPGPQAWKRGRLTELGLGIPDWLHLVPVDFEAGVSWRERLRVAGFDEAAPAIVASTGVSMYLTKGAIVDTLQSVATLAPGCTLAMTFMPPLELVEPSDRPMVEIAQRGAAAAGTPFRSLFSPDAMMSLAREAGFKEVRHVGPAELARQYFDGRSDGLRPSSGEDFLVAST